MSSKEELLKTRIKQAREESDLSLSEAARKIGCSKAHLWELETGKAENPGIKLLWSMAKTYAVSVSWLIGDSHIHKTRQKHDDYMLPEEQAAFLRLSPQDRAAITEIVERATRSWRDQIGHT